MIHRKRPRIIFELEETFYTEECGKIPKTNIDSSSATYMFGCYLFYQMFFKKDERYGLTLGA